MAPKTSRQAAPSWIATSRWRAPIAAGRSWAQSVAITTGDSTIPIVHATGIGAVARINTDTREILASHATPSYHRSNCPQGDPFWLFISNLVHLTYPPFSETIHQEKCRVSAGNLVRISSQFTLNCSAVDIVSTEPTRLPALGASHNLHRWQGCKITYLWLADYTLACPHLGEEPHPSARQVSWPPSAGRTNGSPFSLLWTMLALARRGEHALPRRLCAQGRGPDQAPTIYIVLGHAVGQAAGSMNAVFADTGIGSTQIVA